MPEVRIFMRLFAARLYRGCSGEISRQLVRIECLHIHFNQADEAAPVIGSLPAASVDDHADTGDFCAVSPNNIDRLLDPAAAGDNIFRHDEPLVRANLETAAQDQPARFFLHKNMPLSKGAADFLAHDNPAERRRNHGVAFKISQFIRETSADVRSGIRVLEEQGTLKKLAAMQTGAENEMTVQQCTRATKYREQILTHSPRISLASRPPSLPPS